MEKTYVYDATEVRATGRSATRELRSGRKDILLEVTPVNEISGTWKKWISESDLFAITGTEEEDK